ncbi:hypothetical protein C2E23DRAFT_864345 [Lenzites betulinus]|nr:hypothetical protein C2E23DRAFT_864345 [Lenzites betulinus]
METKSATAARPLVPVRRNSERGLVDMALAMFDWEHRQRKSRTAARKLVPRDATRNASSTIQPRAWEHRQRKIATAARPLIPMPRNSERELVGPGSTGRGNCRQRLGHLSPCSAIQNVTSWMRYRHKQAQTDKNDDRASETHSMQRNSGRGLLDIGPTLAMDEHWPIESPTAPRRFIYTPRDSERALSCIDAVCPPTPSVIRRNSTLSPLLAGVAPVDEQSRKSPTAGQPAIPSLATSYGRSWPWDLHAQSISARSAKKPSRPSSPTSGWCTDHELLRAGRASVAARRHFRLDNASPRDAVCLIRAETLLCLWRGSIAAGTETTRSICTPRPEFVSRSHADWGAHSRVRSLNTQQAAARSERKIFRRPGERTQRRMDMDIWARCAGRARALRILVWTIRNNQLRWRSARNFGGHAQLRAAECYIHSKSGVRRVRSNASTPDGHPGTLVEQRVLREPLRAAAKGMHPCANAVRVCAKYGAFRRL